MVYMGLGMTVGVPSDARTPFAVSPAAGHEAEPTPAEHSPEGEAGEGPKKSFTGKVLSAEPQWPKMTIGSQTVITSQMLFEQELNHATPDTLKSGEANNLLKQRRRLNLYAHNPINGPDNAPITMVEFTDLSCVQCMGTLTVIDDIMAAHEGKIRLVNIHNPVSQFNDVNLAAFYGKVAQRGNVFWAYRKALETLPTPTPEAYFETLITSGMDKSAARRLMQTESRRFYRELDADAELSRQMGLGNPPHVFVNGLHVGENRIPLATLKDVVSYELNRPKRNLTEAIP